MFIKLASDCLKLLYQEIFLNNFFLGIVCHVVRPTLKLFLFSLTGPYQKERLVGEIFLLFLKEGK